MDYKNLSLYLYVLQYALLIINVKQKITFETKCSYLTYNHHTSQKWPISVATHIKLPNLLFLESIVFVSIYRVEERANIQENLSIFLKIYDTRKKCVWMCDYMYIRLKHILNNIRHRFSWNLILLLKLNNYYLFNNLFFKHIPHRPGLLHYQICEYTVCKYIVNYILYIVHCIVCCIFCVNILYFRETA